MDVKTTALLNKIFRVFVSGCRLECHSGYNPLPQLTPDLCVVFHGIHLSQYHAPGERSGWCLDMGTLKKHQRCHFDNQGGE